MVVDAASLEVYRATRRRREAAEAASLEALRERAWAAVGRAGDLLRAQFGARRVVVFGSLVEADGTHFDRRSDIDLAAWGIPADDYFLAVAHLQDVAGEFSVDLVTMERCPEHLDAVIASTGVPV